MRYCLALSLVIAWNGGGSHRLAAEDTPAEAENQARAKALLEHLQSISMEKVKAETRSLVPLVERPLLTFTDPTRANDHGTVWAWSTGGRPVAMVEVYQPAGQMQRIHAMTLTSTDLVMGSISKQLVWMPQSSAIEFQPFPKAPKPADREVTRQSQLKELSRRFEAHEFWDPDNSRFELRLLVQPVYRYRDLDQKIVDGAVFILAHGTNPEAVLLIEAHGETAATAEWKYGLVRLGSAEMHASLDGNEVWKLDRTPNVAGKPTDPYWLCFTQIEKTVPKD